MVVKIQQAAESIANSLAYNERKANGPQNILTEKEEEKYLLSGATGHVIATVNVPDGTDIEDEFYRLNSLHLMNTRGKKCTHPCLHISVNPGEDDKPLSEEEVMTFIDEYLTKMGYGECPYKVYRHDDTGRTHYHIVSTRINQNGTKVPDSFENKRSEQICRSLEKKYGFVLGQGNRSDREIEEELEESNGGAEASENTNRTAAPAAAPEAKKKETSEERKKENKKKDKVYVPPFDKESKTPLSEQYRNIITEAATWHFTTLEQYAALLRYRFNLEVKKYEGSLLFTGLGKYGNESTTPLSEKELGTDVLKDVLQICADTDMKTKRNQRERVNRTAREALENALSWEEYRKMMIKKGIIIALSWNREDEVFGMTYIDRGTKCIWKASETDVDLKWLKEQMKAKGWKIKRSYRYEKKEIEKQTKDTPRQEVRAQTYPSNSPSSYKDKSVMEQLMNIKGVEKTHRDNTDASKNKSDIKYGREDDHDIIL